MQNGVINEHGLSKSDFKRFDRVVSGHFHKHTDDGQIHYNGAQYEMTWSDYKDPKGFHIFDTETREIERVINPLTIHKKIIYDDNGIVNEVQEKLDELKKTYAESYLRVERIFPQYE